MHKRIYGFLEEQGVIYVNQFGFRKNRSTTHALTIIRRIIELGERKKSDSRTHRSNSIELVLLDWEKAFDKIDQKI